MSSRICITLAFIGISVFLLCILVGKALHLNSGETTQSDRVYALPESRQQMVKSETPKDGEEPQSMKEELEVVHKELEDARREYKKLETELALEKSKPKTNPELRKEIVEISTYMRKSFFPKMEELLPYVEYILENDYSLDASDPERFAINYETLREFSGIVDEFTTKLADASPSARDIVYGSMRRNWGDDVAEVFISEVDRKLGGDL